MSRFDAVALGIACFFFGAVLMRMAITYSLRHPKLNLEFFSEADITSAFHRVYHNSWWDRTMHHTFWLGVRTMQTPLDMWVLQEIIHETKPDVLIETGTLEGGGSLYYASVFDLEQNGRILTVDIEDHPGKPKHPRITYFIGSSTSSEVASEIRAAVQPGEKVMVILDSDHSKEHVLREIELYKEYVCAGCYLVVQDTHLTGHPIDVDFSPGPGKEGPMEAVEEFLSRDSRFVADRSREKYGLTFSPKGWLKRVK